MERFYLDELVVVMTMMIVTMTVLCGEMYLIFKNILLAAVSGYCVGIIALFVFAK